MLEVPDFVEIARTLVDSLDAEARDQFDDDAFVLRVVEQLRHVWDARSDGAHRLRVSLMAQVHQWRFQADNLTPAEVMQATAVEERAQTLRECAHEIEKFLDTEWPEEML